MLFNGRRRLSTWNLISTQPIRSLTCSVPQPDRTLLTTHILQLHCSSSKCIFQPLCICIDRLSHFLPVLILLRPVPCFHFFLNARCIRFDAVLIAFLVIVGIVVVAVVAGIAFVTLVIIASRHRESRDAPLPQASDGRSF